MLRPRRSRPMARPLHAQLSLPALRSNLARARAFAPDAQLLAVVKANAYGHGLMRVLPALADADGLALVELDAAIALRDAEYATPHPAARRFLHRGRAARNRGAPDRGCGAQRSAVADAGALAAREADRGVHQDQHRDEPPGDRADERRGSGRAPQQLRIRRRAAADDAFRPRRRGLRHRASRSRVFNAACRGMPYPRSLANSAGVVRYDEVGGEIVRPGIMLYGASPYAYRLGGVHRRAAGDDAALRDHRGAVPRSRPERRLRRVVYRHPPVPHRRRRRAGTPTDTRASRRMERRCW